MTVLPTEGFEDLRWLVARLQQGDDPYPFYGVMLYTPTNGLDARLHEYVLSHWSFLDGLTGETCLLLAMERLDRRRPLDSFRPEEIYAIARYLGVGVDALPALVIFTDPAREGGTRLLRLGEFLVPADDLPDAAITDFFRSLIAALDVCVGSPPDARLRCADEGISKNWPADSQWRDRVAQTGAVVTASAAVGATIVHSLGEILRILRVS
jgi:hypothetical protein